MKTLKFSILTLASVLCFSFFSFTQQVNQINIDQLSDQQLQQYLNQANLSGLSDTEMEAKARQKGLSDDQITKLKQRMQGLGNAGYSTSNFTDSIGLRNTISTPRKVSSSENSSELKIFGSELFTRENLSFEPNLQIPTPRNYVLGVGDQLNIDVYGYSDARFTLTVSREGMIRIPNFGPLKVIGLNFDEAQVRIKSALSKIYPQIGAGKTSVQVSLGQIRTIRITMIGEINRPGSYSLPSLSTIANALYVSGGPTNIGSYRNIELVRNGKTISKFDLYDFILNGDLTKNLRLEDDDIIKVNPYTCRVILNGAVKRKAIYEVKVKDNFNTLLDIAGGFGDLAFKEFIRVSRVSGSQKEVITVKASDFADFRFQSGDSCYVDSIFNRYSNKLVISGAVYHSGVYSLSNFSSLQSLLQTATLREEAYLQRGIIKRRNAQYLPQTVDFNIQNILDGTETIVLQREDSIRIFSMLELKPKDSVLVNGEVNKPGYYYFSEGMQLQDLLLLAGGWNEGASHQRIEVARRIKNDDRIVSDTMQYAVIQTIDLDKGLGKTAEAAAFALEPFDIISVRKNPQYKEQIKVRIEGEVLYPGEYIIESKQEKISDLIKRAGGLRINAYAEGAKLLRNTFSDSVDARFAENKLQTIRNQYLRNDSMSQILINTLTQNRKIVGIQLSKALEDPGSRADINLIDGDLLSVPEIPTTVQSFGAIYVPKKVLYDHKLSFKEVVSQSGGFLTSASRRKAYVMYPNGEIKTTRHFLFIKSYPSIRPGSEIYVPLRDKKGFGLGDIAGITALISGIATTFLLIKSL